MVLDESPVWHLSETFYLSVQVAGAAHNARHLAGECGMVDGLVVDGPEGDRCTTFYDGLMKEPCVKERMSPYSGVRIFKCCMS